ncbi:MAG: hypothetical protein AAB647_01535 [Patescibacteria group bacterium]
MIRLLGQETISSDQRGWRITTFSNADLKLKVENYPFPRERDGVTYENLSSYLFDSEQRSPRPAGIVIVEVDDDQQELFVTYATDDIAPDEIVAYYQSLGL